VKHFHSSDVREVVPPHQHKELHIQDRQKTDNMEKKPCCGIHEVLVSLVTLKEEEEILCMTLSTTFYRPVTPADSWMPRQQLPSTCGHIKSLNQGTKLMIGSPDFRTHTLHSRWPSQTVVVEIGLEHPSNGAKCRTRRHGGLPGPDSRESGGTLCRGSEQVYPSGLQATGTGTHVLKI
jgi:hypothetical protein